MEGAYMLSMSDSHEVPGLVKLDGWLEPYTEAIRERTARFEAKKDKLGSLTEFASAHHHLGIHYHQESDTWTYREWAPRAHSLALTGEFNNWSRDSHLLRRSQENHDIWEITLPGETLHHEALVKVHIIGENGALDRIPAMIRRTVQDEESKEFTGQIWAPPEPHIWEHTFNPKPLGAPRIYEAHIGMGTEEHKVGSYREFAETVLPRIAKLGYNVLQLMAIAEHPYYGSFGYHVANYFAPTSRCGTPEDLKYLIDTAHGYGIAVLMDIVHSHAVKNVAEGLASLDGQEGLYFHTGERAEHPQWDSWLFNYGTTEVIQFLLSNLTYWIQEFRFDGFRFDGVTSMLYHHHGEITFDHYDKYFLKDVEWDAITYLQLANELIHELKPGALSIAEDMSGMPGLCRPLREGGLGFDYRLAMGIPDYWIKLLKHQSDEQWDITALTRTLMDRRQGEKTIAYAESHDQALVGDKSLAFWLMDKEMYTHMKKSDESPIIDRGIALHKIIRILTMVLGGEGYLAFMGNEFGHPEWVDFPREGNNWSYQYCRRQWSLTDNPTLRYGDLERFDQAMLHLAGETALLAAAPAQILNLDTDNNCFQFERGNLIFAVNLNPSESFTDYEFPIAGKGTYQLLLSSDSEDSGGFGRVDPKVTHEANDGKIKVYLPSRTIQVYRSTSLNQSSHQPAPVSPTAHS